MVYNTLAGILIVTVNNGVILIGLDKWKTIAQIFFASLPAEGGNSEKKFPPKVSIPQLFDDFLMWEQRLQSC